MKLISITGAFAFACLASACGGGGGDGGTPAATPAVLSAANQRVAAQETLSTSFAPTFGVQTLTGVQAVDESAVFNFARGQFDKLGSYLAGAKASGVLTGVVPSQTVPCTQGSLTVTVSDPDNNGVVSVGDTVTIVSNACQEPEGLLSGSLSFAINSLSGGVFGSDNYSAGIKLTFGSFTVTGALFSAGVNGDLVLSVAATGVNSVVSTFSTPSLQLTGTFGTETRTRQLSNYQTTVTQVPDPTHSYRTSYTSSGTMSSSALASHPVSFSTPMPFVRYGVDVYPFIGEMVIVGGSSTRLKLVGAALLAASLVEVYLDTGNGVFVFIDQARWTDLM